jgi:hypothetical protein
MITTWQASGVAVHDECVSAFNELKLKHDKKYIIFGMNAQMTEIKVKMSINMLWHKNFYGA